MLLFLFYMRFTIGFSRLDLILLGLLGCALVIGAAWLLAQVI